MATPIVTETGVYRVLRLRYRACWDAYQAIAFDNAELLKKGAKLSDEQLFTERAAAAAVQKARDDLMAAVSRQDRER